MKKRYIVMMCILSLLFTACIGPQEVPAQTNPAGETTAAETSATESSAVESTTEETAIPELSTEDTVVVPGTDLPGLIGETTAPSGTQLKFTEGGTAKIPYTMNQSWAVYITSAEELERYAGDVQALKEYDDAFFENHGLVLVTESVSSGSTKVGVQWITKDGDNMTVTLSHEAPENGTTDMATWLVWAEVESGLSDYQWNVANPALKSEMERY